jgi:hypothetical protein
MKEMRFGGTAALLLETVAARLLPAVLDRPAVAADADAAAGTFSSFACCSCLLLLQVSLPKGSSAAIL